jgi:hypothetical protein
VWPFFICLDSCEAAIPVGVETEQFVVLAFNSEALLAGSSKQARLGLELDLDGYAYGPHSRHFPSAGQIAFAQHLYSPSYIVFSPVTVLTHYLNVELRRITISRVVRWVSC